MKCDYNIISDLFAPKSRISKRFFFFRKCTTLFCCALSALLAQPHAYKYVTPSHRNTEVDDFKPTVTNAAAAAAVEAGAAARYLCLFDFIPKKKIHTINQNC